MHLTKKFINKFFILIFILSLALGTSALFKPELWAHGAKPQLQSLKMAGLEISQSEAGITLQAEQVDWRFYFRPLKKTEAFIFKSPKN